MMDSRNLKERIRVKEGDHLGLADLKITATVKNYHKAEGRAKT